MEWFSEGVSKWDKGMPSHGRRVRRSPVTFWFTRLKKGFESYESDMVLGPRETVGVGAESAGLLEVDAVGFCRGHFRWRFVGIYTDR